MKKNPKKQTAEVRMKGRQSMEATEACLSHIIPCSGLLHYSLYCFLYVVFPDCTIGWLFVDCTYYKWYFSILVFPHLFKWQSVPGPLSVFSFDSPAVQSSFPSILSLAKWQLQSFKPQMGLTWWIWMWWTKSVGEQQEQIWNQHRDHAIHVGLH